MQKTNQKEFRVEKVIKRKGDKLYVKSKTMIVLLIVALIKKDNINEWMFFKTKIFRKKSERWIKFN